MEHHRERNRREIDREGEKEMTRREKVAELMPDAVGCGYVGGVENCPHHYPFLGIVGEKGECLIDKPVHSLAGFSVKCEECWNTEWPEPARPQ